MRHVLELSSASLRHLMIARRVRIASINHEWEPSTGVMLLMAHRDTRYSALSMHSCQAVPVVQIEIIRGLSKQNPRHAVDALKNAAKILTRDDVPPTPFTQAAEIVPELESKELCLTILKAIIQTLSENKATLTYEPEVPHTYKREIWDEKGLFDSLPCLRFPIHVTHNQRNQPLDLAVENISDLMNFLDTYNRATVADYSYLLDVSRFFLRSGMDRWFVIRMCLKSLHKRGVYPNEEIYAHVMHEGGTLKNIQIIERAWQELLAAKQLSVKVTNKPTTGRGIPELLSVEPYYAMNLLKAATLAGHPGRGIELLKLCYRGGSESLSFQEIERRNEWDTYQPYLLWKMRVGSHIGNPQEKIREIAFEMETASNGMEEDGDDAAAAATTTNDNLNEAVFDEKGSNPTMTKEDRLLFASEPLNSNYALSLVEKYCYEKNYKEARSVLQKLMDDGSLHGLRTSRPFVYVIRAASHPPFAESEDINRLVEDAKVCGVPMDFHFYTALLSYYVSRNDRYEARDVLQAITEGKNKGFSVDSVMPYNIYLRCLIGNVTASLEVVDWALRNGTKIDHTTYNLVAGNNPQIVSLMLDKEMEALGINPLKGGSFAIRRFRKSDVDTSWGQPPTQNRNRKSSVKPFKRLRCLYDAADNNAVPITVILDLHGVSRTLGKGLVLWLIRHIACRTWSSWDKVAEMRIITGKGLRSPDGLSILSPAIRSFLEIDLRIPYTEMKYNPGALSIRRDDIDNWKKGHLSSFSRQSTALYVGGVTILGYTALSLAYHFWFYSN